MMQATTFKTETFPAGAVRPIAAAKNVPMRVIVRNISGAPVALSTDPQELRNNVASIAAASGGVYQLPAGAADVFVLAPKQPFYGAGVGGATTISYSVSEAFPIV